MSKPVVLFGVTSFSGSVCREFLPSYIETISALSREGIASCLSLVPGDPYLSKARNRIAYEFLVNWTNCTHLFFLDDDLGWQPSAALRLVQHNVDVVAGCYPKKSDKGEWPAQMETDGDSRPIERNGLWRAKLAPTGFMCIKRAVLEKMAQASGLYVDTTAPGATAAQWNIFDMGWFTTDGDRPANQGGVAGQFWGEDYYFCRRWRDMGGEVWIDPDIMFTHRGSMAWGGNFKKASDEWFATRGQSAPASETEPVAAAAK